MHISKNVLKFLNKYKKYTKFGFEKFHYGDIVNVTLMLLYY